MNNSPFLSILCASVLAITSMTAHAVLVDRGDGLIYDSDQDLTWTQNAGMSGGVNWQEASDWVGILVFGGFDDWRLPTTTQFPKYPDNTVDPACSGDVRGEFFYESRLDCLEGEMEKLKVVAGAYNYFTQTFDNAPFINVNDTRYWTATPYRDGTDPCAGYPDNGYDVACTLDPDNGNRTGFYWQWGFTGWGGINGPAFKTTLRGTNDRYAWAVRDGDVCGGYNLVANRWTMISLPCTPAAPATVSSVFGDDLDPALYGIDWVVYEWDADTDSYSKMPLSDPLKPLSQNKGYWILSLTQANLDVEGNVTQAVASTECPAPGCYEIPLSPPAVGETEQYNLVGHAFPGTVPIPWKDVLIRAGGSVYSPSGALTANIMDKTFWKYSVNTYNEYDDVTAGKIGQLDAFDGFWVRTLENAPADITLLIPKVPAP